MDSSDTANTRPIVAIMGPTATGKTVVAIALAKAVGGEIISADSMAIYRGLDIGTAKPSKVERESVAFHLIDVANPDEQFTVGRFVELSNAASRGIQSRGKLPILVGGTGLYVRAFLEGFGLTATPCRPEVRRRLELEADSKGSEALHEKLKAIDPAAAVKIHPNDRVRVVRALEVIEITGVRISDWHLRDTGEREPKPARRFVLFAPREELYRRIDVRVDEMIQRGLEKEVAALMARGYGTAHSSLRSLGYKEMIAYLSGETDFESAVQAIKQNTRRFAKRQLTWFRTEPDAKWIDVTGLEPGDIAGSILAELGNEPN